MSNEISPLSALELETIKTFTDLEKTKKSKLQHKFKAFVCISGGAVLNTLSFIGASVLYNHTQQFTVLTGLGIIGLGALATLGTDYIHDGFKSIAKLNYQDARETGLSLKINMLREKMGNPDLNKFIKPI